MRTKNEPTPKARLTLVVEYKDSIILDSDLATLIDEAKGYGDVVTAKFEILMPLTRDLLKGEL